MSCSAEGYAFCRSRRIPWRAGTRQVYRFGIPSIRIRHCEHAAAKQKGPRGRWYFTDLENTAWPAAKSEHATGSPSMAGTSSPSKSMEIRFAVLFEELRRGMVSGEAAYSNRGR